MGSGACASELPQKYKIAITAVTMSITICVGFWYQQRLIARRYSDEDLDLYMRVKRIRERELHAISPQDQIPPREASQRRPQ